MLWKFTVLCLRVGFCWPSHDSYKSEDAHFHSGKLSFPRPLFLISYFRSILNVPYTLWTAQAAQRQTTRLLLDPLQWFSPLPYFFHLVLLNFLRFLFSFPAPHPTLRYSIAFLLRKSFFWLLLFQGIFPLCYKPRILKRLVIRGKIKSCSIMFPVSICFVSDQFSCLLSCSSSFISMIFSHRI